MNPTEVFCHMQVQCNAVVCPSSFKTQNYCEMLRELCPEISTASAGVINSSRCDTANDRSLQCQNTYFASRLNFRLDRFGATCRDLNSNFCFVFSNNGMKWLKAYKHFIKKSTATSLPTRYDPQNLSWPTQNATISFLYHKPYIYSWMSGLA